MFAIVGAAGKVGYATSVALRKVGAPVRAILRDPCKAERLSDIGCEIALADMRDTGAFIRAIDGADAVQIILPSSPRTTVAGMRAVIESLAFALEQAKPTRVLAISDYGAHVDDDIGMPSMCRRFEERLDQLDAHRLFLRSAEHMQNWGRAIPSAVMSGHLRSFHDPLDRPFPTISAPDLGDISADLLLRPFEGKNRDVVHAEGPRRYSANDVAAALGELSGQAINAQGVPRSRWSGIFERDMTPCVAELVMKAGDARNAGGLVDVEPDVGEVRYGTTELVDALRPLVSLQ